MKDSKLYPLPPSFSGNLNLKDLQTQITDGFSSFFSDNFLGIGFLTGLIYYPPQISAIAQNWVKKRTVLVQTLKEE